jgi:hypothetical protein
MSNKYTDVIFKGFYECKTTSNGKSSDEESKSMNQPPSSSDEEM